ncbi:hypothetical protein GCM10010433_00060 [Streptomyces pulveraceus]|uniref:STAS domain-containing protein n=1 Tax=Streptomyces pulveraceus TaxID=68258 RepID=A0ABW1GSQ7_9ACTN
MTPNVLIVTGRVTRAAVPGLCAELEALLRDLDDAACDRNACDRDACGRDACGRGVFGRDDRDSDAHVPGACDSYARDREVRARGASARDACARDAWVDCDVGGVVHVDLALVEAMARLGLVARRAGGRRLRLRHVPPELRSLLDLVGLADVVDMGYEPGAGPGAGPGPGDGVG